VLMLMRLPTVLWNYWTTEKSQDDEVTYSQ